MKNKIFSLICCLLALNIIQAQEFQYKGTNPFGLKFVNEDSTKNVLKVIMFDTDTDGDLDAVLVGIDFLDSIVTHYKNIHYFIETQENIGDRWHPQFSSRKPFMDHFPFPDGYFFPVMGDLNHDGMADLFVTCGVDSVLNLEPLYYQRIANTGDNQFDIKGSDFLGFDLIPNGSFMVPDLGDMDLDGDLDILMSGFINDIDETGNRYKKPIFLYAKNTGTITQPKFFGWYQNPYGLANALDTIQFSTIGDIDNDNDNDILSLTTYDTFKVLVYLENNHLTNGKANFDNFSSLFGLPVAGKEENLLFPSLADMDSDGDLDLIIVRQREEIVDSGIEFYENLLCTESLDNTITQSGNLLRANQTGVKYQWYDCNLRADIAGATSQTYQPTKSGRYAVKLEKENRCENISMCFNFVLSATEEQILANQINLFPNPAGEYFVIENNTDYPLLSVVVRNNVGQIIRVATPRPTEKIGTADLVDGIYIVDISIGPWKISKPLVIINSGK